MKHLEHRRRSAYASVVVAVAIVIGSAWRTPAAAIVGGTPDVDNIHANVGAVQYLFEGSWFSGCTGTLVAPDLVLTAAHCVAFPGFPDVPIDEVRVNFNPLALQPSAVDDPLAYAVTAVAAHPDFQDAPIPTGNAKNALASPWEEVALIWLVEDVAGIDPAPVAGLGYLDGIDLRAASFTAVGYGLNGFVSGSASSPVGSVLVPEYRSFRSVSALGHDAFPDRFLKISAANCFGDSGGALFHGSTLVAVTVWTNSARCSGPGLDYRLDSAVAQQFLAANLP